ncbi:hypothetical protein T492DRAFT_884970, partial [Pavlovales sp. CCMP2436]
PPPLAAKGSSASRSASPSAAPASDNSGSTAASTGETGLRDQSPLLIAILVPIAVFLGLIGLLADYWQHKWRLGKGKVYEDEGATPSRGIETDDGVGPPGESRRLSLQVPTGQEDVSLAEIMPMGEPP